VTKIVLCVVLVLVAVPAALAAAPDGKGKSTTPGSNGAGGRALVAKLSGANEVPVANSADRGHVVVRLNERTLKICWSFSALKLSANGGLATAPTAAHIHIGAKGVAGSIVVPLGATYARKGCTTATDEVVEAILENAKGYYVNVHNASYPGGAIRGQLKKGAPTT